MKEVTFKEIIDFIFAQPDENMVNMMETDKESDCGCVMVQYGRKNNIEFDFAGRMAWNKRGESALRPIPVVGFAGYKELIWNKASIKLDAAYWYKLFHVIKGFEGTYKNLKTIVVKFLTEAEEGALRKYLPDATAAA